MNSKLTIMSLILVLGISNAFAQVETQTLDGEVDSEIDQMYSKPAATKQAAPQSGSAVVTQTIVVPQQQPQVQKQPTTYIEASPLGDSRAENIRKNRMDEEMKTESRIVEKLEQSRMEDEKRRAAVLFGDKFNNMQAPAAESVPVQQPTVQPVQPTIQPVIIEKSNDGLTREDLREEIRSAMEAEETAIVAPVETKYFAGVAGIGEYPDVKNVRGNYSLGAAFGTRYDYLMVEGSFLMSNYSVDLVNYGYNYGRLDQYEVDQYQGAITAKYQLLGGVVRPVLGGSIAYSYRKFSLTNSITGSAADTGNSHAIDLGVNTGVDLEFSPKFSLGVELKYMFNMSSRVTSNYANSTYGYIGTPIEKLQYYIATIAARVNF